MRGRVAFALLLGLAASGPVVGRHRAPEPTDDWHAAATDADRDRLRRWRTAFTQALAQAQVAHAREIAEAGLLLQPDAARSDPLPPTGAYRCRTIKLGTQNPDRPTFLAYPAVPCRIARGESGAETLAVFGGAQRPVGALYPDGDMRMVFLGTMMLGDEATPLSYGRDGERNLIGAWERLGASRWRLVLPFPHWQSTLDVIEVTPAG